MLYQNVCLEAVAHTLPEEVVTSAEIEARLEPLYTRLRLPEGRLELMTGIRERRFWLPDVPPSEKSVETAAKALDRAGIDRGQIGALVHGSVCRDFLEPATACGVHHRLGLPNRAAVYDVSNACLGLLSGVVQVANMIELGQIRAGVVVGTESGRGLVESTIAHLNADTSLSRQDIKTAFASLTIGSGSAAIVLCDRELSRAGNRLLGGVMLTATEHCELCQGGSGQSAVGSGQSAVGSGQSAVGSGQSAVGSGQSAVGSRQGRRDAGENLSSPFGKGASNGLPSPFGRGAGGEGGPGAVAAATFVSPPLLMATDSETLMREGVAVAQTAFAAFLEEMRWQPGDIQKTFCHQVGRAHHRLLFESLGLDQRIDFSTFEYLGNTGAAALPTAASLGIEGGHVHSGDRVALFGIGSGINVIMLGLEWA
jgi:3-oxoacyl-[acyl-carrier-protein] synthase III